MTSGVDQAVPRNVQKPGLWFFRDTFRRPSPQCRDERVAERVFGGGEITRARSKKGDQPPIRIARDRVDYSVRRGFVHQETLLPTTKCDPNSGRTSTAESAAAGCRA